MAEAPERQLSFADSLRKLADLIPEGADLPTTSFNLHPRTTDAYIALERALGPSAPKCISNTTWASYHDVGSIRHLTVFVPQAALADVHTSSVKPEVLSALAEEEPADPEAVALSDAILGVAPDEALAPIAEAALDSAAEGEAAADVQPAPEAVCDHCGEPVVLAKDHPTPPLSAREDFATHWLHAKTGSWICSGAKVAQVGGEQEASEAVTA